VKPSRFYFQHQRRQVVRTQVVLPEIKLPEVTLPEVTSSEAAEQKHSSYFQSTGKLLAPVLPIAISIVALVVSGLSYTDQHQSNQANEATQEESIAVSLVRLGTLTRAH
jgi:hypothetical protein